MVEADGKEMKGVEDVRLGKPMSFNPVYTPIVYWRCPLRYSLPNNNYMSPSTLFGYSGDSAHIPLLAPLKLHLLVFRNRGYLLKKLVFSSRRSIAAC